MDKDENRIIALARKKGFAGYFPAFPSAKAQAERTLAAAIKFLADLPQDGMQP